MDKTIQKVLASCLDSIEKGESLDRCLARYPEMTKELEPLLRAALFVHRATRINARSEFKASTRRRLLSSLKPGQPSVLKRPFLSWHFRWTVALASLLVVLLGSGTIVMANNSLPDQPLYPVKVATEEVQLALTPNKIYKAQIEMDMVERRTEEIAELARLNRFNGIERANRRLARHLDRFVIIIISEEDNHTEVRAELEALLEWKAARHQAILEGTLIRTPYPASPELRNAIERSKTSYQEARKKIWEEKIQKRKKLQEQKQRFHEQGQDLPRKNRPGKAIGEPAVPSTQPAEEPSEY